MRHLFIINPAAGKPETTWQLEEQLRGVHVPYETAYTRKSGDALRIARAAAETGEPVRIYACGGDGTLNEVVNGEVCTMRGKKIRPGDDVVFQGEHYTVAYAD